MHTHTHTQRKLEEKWVELTTGIISVPKWLAGQGMFWFVATRLTGQRHTQLIKLPLVFRTHKPVELCNRNVHFTTPQPYGNATTVTSQHPNPMEKQQLLQHNTPTLWKSDNCYNTTPQPSQKRESLDNATANYHNQCYSFNTFAKYSDQWVFSLLFAWQWVLFLQHSVEHTKNKLRIKQQNSTER